METILDEVIDRVSALQSEVHTEVRNIFDLLGMVLQIILRNLAALQLVPLVLIQKVRV